MEYTYVPVSPKNLKLYVAKTDGNWLSCNDPNVKRLQEGVVPAEITDLMARNGEMDDTYPMLHTAFGFPDEENSEDVDYIPENEDIHIIVDFSEQAKNELRLLRSLDESVRRSQVLPKLMGNELPRESIWNWLATFFSSPREASPSKKEV